MVVKHGPALVTYQLIGKVGEINTRAAQWRVAHYLWRIEPSGVGVHLRAAKDCPAMF
jgi:hypothetical protein